MLEPIALTYSFFGVFCAGVYLAQRAFDRDRETLNSRNRDAYDQLAGEIERNVELETIVAEQDRHIAALQAQNRSLATQRFQLLQGGKETA